MQQVLGRQLRQEGVPHDCERDALAAMELVLHGLRHGCRQDLTPPATQVTSRALHMSYLLLVSLDCVHCMICVGMREQGPICYSGLWPSLAMHVELGSVEQARPAHAG